MIVDTGFVSSWVLFIQIYLPSGPHPDLTIPQAMFLVALHDPGCQGLHFHLSRVCPGKVLHQPPAGLHNRLPTPRQTWSPITVDFVTALPTSDGNSTLVTAVDGFSKAVYFIPLSNLPTTTKTVFWLQGFLKYIVSDQGPQLASQAWRAFCSTLGTSVSISSGYHLKFNGQTERTIQSLESALQCMAAQHRASLSLFMPWIEYAVLAGLCCHKNVLIHGFRNIPTTYEF